MRETTSLNRLVRAAATPIGAVLGLGTFMAVLSPFSTGAFGWPAVWFYWVVMMAIGSAAGLLARRVAERRGAHWSAVTQWLFVSACAAAPVAIVVTLVDAAADRRAPGFIEALVIFFYVVVVSVAVTGVGYLIGHARQGGAQDGSQDGAPERAPFLDRLPTKLKGAQVLAVQAEDHYLRVHTSAGDDLILLRLSDAERELAPLDGLRVHRSWWVAREAVAEVDRTEGRMTLKLKNGLEAPVSRTYARAVREAGWT